MQFLGMNLLMAGLQHASDGCSNPQLVHWQRRVSMIWLSKVCWSGLRQLQWQELIVVEMQENESYEFRSVLPLYPDLQFLLKAL